MKKKKYGEETVVIRIPASRKEDVLKFLERFEVIGDFSPPKDLNSSNAIHEAYRQGFLDCFQQWEDYQHCLPFIFTDNEEHIPLVLDIFRGRVADSAVALALEKLTKVMMSCPRKMAKVENQLLKAQEFLDDSFAKARAKVELFGVVNRQIASDTNTVKLTQQEEKQC